MIRAGIVGLGNIGRGVLQAIRRAEDFEAVAVFTRRDPQQLAKELEGVPAVSLDEIAQYKDKVDVLLLCGGSKSDLPVQGPELAKQFHIVDSFDTHADIPAYLAKVDAAARTGNKTAVISSGWDPGLFSMLRVMSQSVLPGGNTYTFWGRGVSQGHSDAVRRVAGVEKAVQYTIPVEAAVEAVRAGENPSLTTRQKHTRVCYVVAKEGADLAKISEEIKNMPNYFADYDTTVHFITAEEFKQQHGAMPHAGRVLHSGVTGNGEQKHVIEFSLRLDSNPEFTSSAMVAFARAAVRLAQDGKAGGFTPFDIPLCYLSPVKREELIKDLL